MSFMAAILALLLTSASVLAQDGGEIRVRFVHAIPGAAAIDVFTDGQLTISALEFGKASTYANLPAGQRKLTVTQAGVTTSLWEQTINPTPGSALTLVAVATNPPAFAVYQDDLSPIALGKARLTAIHAIAGAPTVDLLLADGRPVIPGLEFTKTAGTLDVPTFSYTFAVAPTGKGLSDAILKPDPIALSSSTAYSIVVYGTAASPASLVLTAPTAAQGSGGFVRLAHGVPGAPAVDVFVNGTLFAPSVSFGQLTEHVAVPAGTYDVAIRAVGKDQDLATASLTVEDGKAVTAAALGSSSDIKVEAFADNVGGIDAKQARISLINALEGDATVSLALKDGTSIAKDVAAGKAGDAANIQPSAQALSLTVTTGGTDNTVDLPAETFYGGVYYNVLALSRDGKATLVIAPTSLAQGIASAPGANSRTLVAAAPTQASAPTTAPEPTLAPPTAEAQQPTAPTEVAQEPTAAAPTEAPALNPPPQQAATGPVGRVFNLDADRNLQLRQYPNSQALSLGTVPPGTTIAVNGREGAIIEIPSSAIPKPPEGYQFVDPASKLGEKEDLNPEATWLNITYTTGDGGQITAWGNALYIDVRNAKDERIRLRDLPLIPANLPGEVNNTAVTPPPIPRDRVAAIVFNLDADTNLNIRRTPNVNGEVLARLPNGTVLEFLGLNQKREWVFVRYTPASGGAVTGWVSPLYVTYSLNDKTIKVEDMEKRNLLVTVGDDQRGEQEAGAEPVTQPTANPVKNAILADVVLDPGSNLNLRRNADANSEVLARIPAGTQLIVKSRTGDGRWLNVTFESQDGWIAARADTATFVRLTLNGKRIEIPDVPTAEGQTNSLTVTPKPTVTTAGPTPTEVLMIVNDGLVQLTGSPGGSADGLPIVAKDTVVTLLFTDGKFSYIRLPSLHQGWVPAGALRPK
jgi:uncharacterized protein YgiM (DUF1202 family)